MATMTVSEMHVTLNQDVKDVVLLNVRLNVDSCVDEIVCEDTCGAEETCVENMCVD